MRFLLVDTLTDLESMLRFVADKKIAAAQPGGGGWIVRGTDQYYDMATEIVVFTDDTGLAVKTENHGTDITPMDSEIVWFAVKVEA